MNENRLILAAIAAMTILLLGAAYMLRPSGQPIQIMNSPEAGNFITMSGTGTVSVKPDTAIIHLGFVRQADTAQAAQAEATKAMNAVIAALKAQGVAEAKMQTASFQVHPQYDYGNHRGGAPTLVGYQVHTSLRIESKTPEAAGSLVDAAIAAGANQVAGIAFTVQEVEKLQEEALAKAVGSARQKAEVAAKGLGVNIASVRRVVVGQPSPAPYYTEGLKMAAADTAQVMQVQPGELEVKVSVTVEFNLK